MRNHRLLMMVPVMAALALSGCATTPGGTPTVPALPQNVTDTVVAIKDAVKTACGYEPTVDTITSILSGIGVPYVGMVSTVANQVCSVVTKFGARRGGARAMTVRHSVTGTPTTVVVRGKFVR